MKSYKRLNVILTSWPTQSKEHGSWTDWFCMTVWSGMSYLCHGWQMCSVSFIHRIN